MLSFMQERRVFADFCRKSTNKKKWNNVSQDMGMRQQRTVIPDRTEHWRQAFSWSLLTYGENFQTTVQGRAVWNPVESLRRQG